MLLICGALGIDTIITPFKTFFNIMGGSAVYSSLASALFCPTKLFSIVGRDYPQEYIKFLKDKNVDTSSIEFSKKNSFFWKAQYGDTWEERTTLQTNLNCLEDFDPIVSERYKQAEFILCTNIHPKQQLKFLQHFSNAKLRALDTIEYWINHFRSDLELVLNYVDVLIVNESELCLLSGHSDLREGADFVMEFGVQKVIVKKGADGVVMFDKDSSVSIPAYPVDKVVDPTGAGDAFAGAFMACMVVSKDMSFDAYYNALKMAAVVASFAIQSYGVSSIQKLERSYATHCFDKYND